MADRVAAYMPGYRLRQDVQFEIFGHHWMRHSSFVARP
jgi:acetaldehyde dehydrogenase (acetylating)